MQAALDYRNKYGFSVIPTRPGSKKADLLPSWLPYQEKIASEEDIRRWWGQWPDANIGIVTGEISNLTVIDGDAPEAVLEIEQHIASPIPIVLSAREGHRHYYFKYNKDWGKSRRISNFPPIDIKSDGGVITAPPSYSKEYRKSYQWMKGCELDVGIRDADLPLSIYINNSLYRDVTKTENPDEKLLQGVTFSLSEGSRSDELFKIGCALIDQHMTPADVLFLLKNLGLQCRPKFPEREIEAIMRSIMSRKGRKERNVQQEIDCYIAVTDGEFSVTSCYNVLQAVTKEDKQAIRAALSRRKDKTIEKSGNKDGVYRRINAEINFIDFNEDVVEDPFDLKLPLKINDMVDIFAGNIILVAGEYNAGKTAFLMNVLQMNKNKHCIRYFSSEMGRVELEKRFRGFGLPRTFWMPDSMTDYVRQSRDFQMTLKPDGINIIDYLEFPDSDFTKGAEMLTKIHDKLQGGIAVVGIQQKQGAALPRSGDLVLEKPRLAVAMKKDNSATGDLPIGLMEVLKAKNLKAGKADGKKLRFEITDRGSKFRILNDWGFWR
jgi:hypothetical protein